MLRLRLMIAGVGKAQCGEWGYVLYVPGVGWL